MSFTPQPFVPSGNADFSPTQGNYSELKPFRYWCQKVLPLVYDDSLSYYELLCKVVDYLNKTMEDVETLHDDVDNLHTAYGQLENNMNQKYTDMSAWVNQSYQDLVDFVNDYFDNLDVQEEINNKLDDMASDGSLTLLIKDYVDPIYEAYEEQINGEIEGITGVVNVQNNRILALEGRMDEFTNLPEGSTTGDAELADVRVSYNGTTYANAGTSVRKQVQDLHNLNTVTDSLIINNDYTLKYYGDAESQNLGTWSQAPYAPIGLETDIVIKSVKAYFETAGKITFGLYKGTLATGLNLTDDSMIYIETIIVNDTGYQTIELSIPIYVPAGYHFIYGRYDDTSVTRYGGTPHDSGYYLLRTHSASTSNVDNRGCGLTIEYGKLNMYNITNANNSIEGYIVNANDGNPIRYSASDTGAITDYIYVGNYDTLYIHDEKGTHVGAFYDKNKCFINSVTVASTDAAHHEAVIIPSNAVYYRDSFTVSYNDGSRYWLYATLKQNTNKHNNLYPITYKNIFTTENHTKHAFPSSSTGELVTNSTSNCTDFIDISKYKNPIGIITTFTAGMSCACYDENKDFVEGFGYNAVSGVLVNWSLPATAKYIKVPYRNDCPIITILASLNDITVGKEIADNEYENFTYTVDTGVSNDTLQTVDLQDTVSVGVDRGLIMFPHDYSYDKKPVKLCICLAGSTTYITEDSVSIENFVIPVEQLLAEGYACLQINGTPNVESTQDSNGSPIFLRCIKKAYEYVTNKYNIDMNGVYLCGYSHGTLECMQIVVNKALPVRACIVYGPDLDLWKIEYTFKNATIKERMTENFNFTEKTANELVSRLFPEWTGIVVTKPSTFSGAYTVPSTHEKAYILNNIDTWCNYNPITANLGSGSGGDMYSVWSRYDASETPEESALYDGNIILDTPVKLFVGTSDTITAMKFSKWFHRMCVNGGGNCELRVYNGVTHRYASETSAITVELNDGFNHNTRVDCYEGMLFLRRH